MILPILLKYLWHLYLYPNFIDKEMSWAKFYLQVYKTGKQSLNSNLFQSVCKKKKSYPTYFFESDIFKSHLNLPNLEIDLCS